jgi:hypothetical protein
MRNLMAGPHRLGGRSPIAARLCLGLSVLALGTIPAGLGRAQAVGAAYPPDETFRRLRLVTLICGRDNTEEACTEARSTADPLLDHPLLSASCKDALWDIRQRAKVAPSNSFERRDPIDEAAQQVMTFCRRQPQRPTDEEQKGSSGQGGGGLRLIPQGGS